MDTPIFDSATRRAGVSLDPANSRTLPGWTYNSAELFEAEKEAVFFKTWQYGGAASQVAEPGGYITAQILDQSVIIIRGLDGTLRGFHNVCSHRAHQLLKGCGHVRTITCPYHAWGFKTDGQMRSARGAEKLPDFNFRDFDLKPVRVEIFADHFVFFNLDPEATPLRELVPDLEEDMRREIVDFDQLTLIPGVARPNLSVQANWKVMVDNYLECYHCAPAHHAFADLLDMNRYLTRAAGLWSTQHGEVRNADSSAYKVPPDSRANNARFWWLWPNITFGVLPGDPSTVSMMVFHPVGPRETRSGGQIFTARGETPDPARVEYIKQVLGPEDVELCESVQHGLASKGYTQGRFIYDPDGGQLTEQAVHHFHTLVVEALDL
jgi:phenylpropionate dioxygenase-like ring-hydroxylating dioxygenase large terminal subunit